MNDFKIKNKIRLIELFAGIGTQAMALRNIGADFERYKVIEFDKAAINSYNAIHNTNFEPTDIRNITGQDLEIKDTDKYTYLMTYSFPCTDISVSGKRLGMTKNSGTRSGLLWEIERLLNETTKLPQVLVMENVTEVHSKKNVNDFNMWIDYLSTKGYKSKWIDFNARDFDLPQNRERCIMVSILSNDEWKEPQKIAPKRKLNDFFEDTVSESEYIKEDRAKEFIEDLANRNIIKKDL